MKTIQQQNELYDHSARAVSNLVRVVNGLSVKKAELDKNPVGISSEKMCLRAKNRKQNNAALSINRNTVLVNYKIHKIAAERLGVEPLVFINEREYKNEYR